MKEGTFGPDKQKFTYNAFLLFVQGLFNLLLAFAGTLLVREPQTLVGNEVLTVH